MSGHSKWANIRVKKTAQDAKRGKIFTRHARLIEIVARSGGADPDTNAALRTAIDNAKADSVPNANIERAIKKGIGEGKGEMMAEVMYAAMGPGGSALLIECLSDNTNRTLGNVRNILGKNGGRFAESASIAWMFEQKGIIVASSDAPLGEEHELMLIDAGAEDIDHSEKTLSVKTSREGLGKVRNLLTEWGFKLESAGLQYIPKQTVDIEDQKVAEELIHLIEALEEDEDVAEVHTNAAIREA